MTVLDAFKIKPFDLAPVYAAWPASTGPRFLGDPRKDLPVDDWLKAIKAGCLEHRVPQEYWHTCAQHFMGDQARSRFDELRKVMAQMHGGKYRWNWKKFKVAMRNMSWDIDTSETEAVKVPNGPFWWLPGRNKTKSESDGGSSKFLDSEEAVLVEEPESLPSLSRSGTFMSLKSERPGPTRSSTIATMWRRRNSKDEGEPEQAVIPARPAPRQVKSDGAVIAKASTMQVASTKDLPPIPGPVVSKDKDGTTVRAPAWLLNATHALDFLQNEHPKVMSTISAILIVAGSIPSLPGVAAGAGGAVLASSTAHAVGAIAVGIGSWIKTQQEMSAAQASK
ncbi:hypothetical protein HMN09_00595200 [Mycena chlorophos]|uniref:Uncharacterized protein n=1 Tax=Mycena chlorophos TaxID=658473 RepID=A0A8H6T5C2_MYCCL|nr:hypothetical protein HMN09_00595200 [Mycena chlorophos]